MASFFKSGLGFIGALIAKNYLFLLFVLTLFWTYDFSNKSKGGIIWSDAEGYYMYLPAVFIYGGFEEIPVRTPKQFKRFEDTNKYFTKYTYGVALMQMPFFLGFHTAAAVKGEPLTGYSDYYIFALLLAAAFYGFIGLFYLQKILERNFSGWVTLLTILCIYFGTNLYYYTTREVGMSHVYSFCLFAIFVYYTPEFYKRVKFKTFALFGLLAGLIVLIRPTNIILLLYLIFYNIYSWSDLRQRFYFFLRHWWKLPVIPFFSFLVFIPQMIYWHHISGDWIYYSYGNQGFSNWAKPKINSVLFDIKNGWLFFSPMMAIAVIGAFIGTWKNKYNISWILLILLLALYVFASWWCWWFGGAFGHRSFIEFYALLAIPFAYVSHLIFRQKYWGAKLAYLLLLGLLVYYNQGLIEHYVGPHYTWKTWNAAIDKMF
jgi:hypothetical protein